MKKPIIFAAIGLVASSVFSTAHADDHLSYDYIEAAYLQADDSVDVSGFDFNGSADLGNDIYATLDYVTAEADDFDIESDGYKLSLGYAVEAGKDSDVLFELGYAETDVDDGMNSVTVDATVYGIGYRTAALGEGTDLTLMYEHFDGDGFDEGYFGAEFYYSFTENFAGGVEVLDDGDTLGFGVRWNF